MPGWGLVEAWSRCGGDASWGVGGLASLGVGLGLSQIEVWDAAWDLEVWQIRSTCHTWQVQPATRGSSTCHTWQLHLPHVAAPPATCGRSTCHTKKGCSATLKRIHLPPRIVPQPFPRSPAPALPTPPYQTPKPSHQPFPTTLPQPANYLPKLPLTLQFSKVE